MKQCKLSLDPRTKLLMVVAVISAVFAGSDNDVLQITMIVIMGLVFFIEGLYKSILKFGVTYILLTGIQYVILPCVSGQIAMMLSVFIYFKVIFPCALPGIYLFQTTSVREMMEAMKRMHISEKLIIAMAVMMRYFPAVKEEFQSIWDAMSLRNINGIGKKLEYIYVPMLMGTVQVAEELSAAAVTRGIDNPGTKTSYVEVDFKIRDRVVIMTCVLLIIGVMI